MLKTRKYRCWVCGSLDVIKWGIREGKQRFKYKECGALNTIRITSSGTCFSKVMEIGFLSHIEIP